MEGRIADLEQELKARDDFLAFAAHELRNPMTPISAQIELLLARARNADKVLPNEVVQGLEQLHQLIEAYMRRATTLLEVSRFLRAICSCRSRRLTFRDWFDADGGTGRLRGSARCAGRDLRTVRPDGYATDPGESTVKRNPVRFGKTMEVAFGGDGRMTQLSVGDQGIGISEEDQTWSFEHFYNLRRTSPKGGFGVGLWVTRQIIRTMEGEITVSSSPGKGSVLPKVVAVAGGEDNAH